jgi:hypothetical protein
MTQFILSISWSHNRVRLEFVIIYPFTRPYNTWNLLEILNWGISPFINISLFSAKCVYFYVPAIFLFELKGLFVTVISPFGKIQYTLWFEIFRDVLLRRLVEHYRRFEGSQCLPCFGKYFPSPQELSGSKSPRLYSLTLKIKTFRLFAPRKLLTVGQVVPSQKIWVSSNTTVGTTHLAKQFNVW